MNYIMNNKNTDGYQFEMKKRRRYYPLNYLYNEIMLYTKHN